MAEKSRLLAQFSTEELIYELVVRFISDLPHTEISKPKMLDRANALTDVLQQLSPTEREYRPDATVVAPLRREIKEVKDA